MTSPNPDLVSLWKRRAHPFQPAQLESPPSWFVQRRGREVDDLVKDFVDPLTSEPGRWPHVVLVGNRGSGKTFHLHQFADRIRRAGDWFPVFLDLERTFELQSLRTRALEELQPWELVLLAAAAVIRAVPEWLTDPTHNDTLGAIERAATKLLSNTTPETPAVNLPKLAAGVVGLLIQSQVGLPAAGVLQAAMSTEKWSLPLARRENAVEEDDPNARDLLEAVDDLLRRVSARLGRQVVLVLDGVDRASAEDDSTTRRLLVSDTSLARLDCPVICTAGPIWYRLNAAPESRRWRTEMLDNVTVCRRTEPWKPEPDGVKFFRDLCERRLADVPEQVDDVFETVALERLAYYSGGVAREFVRLVHRSMSFALRDGLRRIGHTHAMSVVTEAGRELDPGWTAQDTAIVEAVRARPYETPDLPGLARAMSQQLIRPYRNGVFWWGLNPLLFRHRFPPPGGENPPE